MATTLAITALLKGTTTNVCKCSEVDISSVRNNFSQKVLNLEQKTLAKAC
ncbi:MAG: hypothetical protein RMY64_29380 [Nostoc sp. DedQUE08]|nr:MULTISPECIES: hypothetical protein [unclassified Nostoc]MDZ8034217.1 hypothetical protein [Nostoc sp. DedSLP04]MDZ8069673.1 hypothetical protein [Nostoc sp. DedQUE08]MDZ8130513.1 hypothetical protein [Nostoc sp. DedQUE07]MDZ8135085.1 hypothetical protein [Nostoc sp. DedQUE04]